MALVRIQAGKPNDLTQAFHNQQEQPVLHMYAFRQQSLPQRRRAVLAGLKILTFPGNRIDDAHNRLAVCHRGDPQPDRF